MTFGLVLRSRRFWILLAVYAICGFQDFFIATHIVAFALDEGIEPLLAGNVLAWMGLFGLAGVLAAGWLSDRYGPTLPTRICFAIRIGVFSAATLSRDPSVIVALALLFGLTFWITAPLTIVFTRAVFGSTMLGTVSGLITMVHHSAGGLGAYVGAAIFDASRSYDDAFRLMLALTALAFVLTLMLKRVPPA